MKMVTAVIPAYKPTFIRQAIDSVLAQTYPFIELIVVNDGSPYQELDDICKSYGKRIRYIVQNNAGSSVARNTGIKHASGEFLAFLDDDDKWMPDKIQKQVDYYNKLVKDGKNVGLIYTGQEMIREDGTPMARSIVSANGQVYRALLYGNFVGTCSLAFIPKSVFDDIGDYNPAFICSQDFDLWLRIAQKYEVYSLDEVLIQYRYTLSSISKDPDLCNSDNLAVLNYQIENNPSYFTKELIQDLNKVYLEVRALHYKNWAYSALFEAKNPQNFRKYFRSGCKISEKLFGLKARLLYCLSYFPISFITSFRKDPANATALDIPTVFFEVIDKYDAVGVMLGKYKTT